MDKLLNTAHNNELLAQGGFYEQLYNSQFIVEAE